MAPYIQTIEAFVELGKYLSDFCENQQNESGNQDMALVEAISKAEQHNGWFTKENILFALEQWANLLTKDQLESWISKYGIKPLDEPKTVGIVMAGNIPLVGFHDFLCVLLSGHRVMVKLSSNDKILLPFLANFLIKVNPELAHRIQFVEGKMENFDAVIATGSNNTGRYFEYYFGKKPNIIRKNRNSVAILTGEESKEELEALGEDVFRYYGLGCRNVSKLYVPKGYDFEPFFNAMYAYKDIIHQHKYANNYDYNKAVYLMSEFQLLDNGFLVLKEEESLASPISVLFYSNYETKEELTQVLENRKEDIQCLVTATGIGSEVKFGETQKPRLDDYADGVDTMAFLLQL
ncbi:acyl-CoA reductase [Flagellimonas beolgyonensis]|uniref:acyl-CoA reductase n=1 Tax=Flagellimonas beolgyonensis TaxID=864064 RepID=UPI000F8C53E4|nr:acyl-CoA reductase [Allomuricauda beolgyonensis]